MTCIAGNNTSKMAALMGLLKRDMHGAVVESMAQRGITYPCSWGVSLPAVRKAAAGFAPDHYFARFLYGQQIRELQLSAYVIADPALVGESEMAFWGEGVKNPELAENLAFSLLSRTELPVRMIGRWLEADCSVLLKYCALLTLARMSGKCNTADKEYILDAAHLFVGSTDILLRNAAENLLLKMEI